MLIIISGPKNAGKTTLANLLVKRIEHSAVVEVDQFFPDFPNLPAHKSGTLCLEKALEATERLLNDGQHVIIPYPFTHMDYQKVTKRFSETTIHLFTLSLPIETARKRQKDRLLTEEEEYCLQLNYRLEVNQPSYGTVLQSDKHSPEEMANTIQQQIMTNASLAS